VEVYEPAATSAGVCRNRSALTEYASPVTASESNVETSNS
jgi:hypothetical protein